MKLKTLILSLAGSGIISGASATTAPINYDTTTGAVVPGTQPFDFPISTKTGGLGAMSVFNVKSAPYNGKGDGVTDDTTPIQTAINDASAVGGTVYLPGGTWMFRYLSVTNNNCAIQGAGKDITILKSISGPDSNKTLISLTNAPSSAIRDLTVDASGATAGSNYALLLYNCSSSEVANVHVLSAYNIGIGFTSCQSLRIRDSVVENSRNGVGILTNTSDCSGTTISYCSILNSGQSAIQILGSAETVDHCYISGAGPTGTTFAGVYVAQGARRCIVSNNIINSCNSGIDVSWGAAAPGSDGGPDNSEGIIVTGNNCSRSRGVGISTASNGTIIADNICMDNGDPSKPEASGIGVTAAKNVLIRGNIVGNSAGISGPQKYGILFRHVNADPTNNTVLANDLRGNALAPIIAEDLLGNVIALPGHVFAHNRGLDDGIRKYTSTYTITSADQGATFANIGAGGTVTFTLPSAEEGLTYTFAVYPTFLVKIQATSSNLIYIGNSNSGANGFISNAASGSIITLRAVSTSRWYAVTHEGTWSLN